MECHNGHKEACMSRLFDPVTLKLFVAVCEERNIARAAEREAIVASAISKRIAAIEDQVGVTLLKRGQRGIEPTAAGEVLLRQARDVLGIMERMHAELGAFTGGAHGSVRVLASLSVLTEFLPDDIGSFLVAYPVMRVSLEERVSTEIVRSVREGAADFGVLWDAGDLSGLQTVPYRSDHVHVILPPGHPLANRRRLRFEECLAHDTVGVLPGSIMETTLRRYAALAGGAWVPRVQVSTFDAACRIVAARLGLAILPRESAEPYATALGLTMVPLVDSWAHRRFVICLRSHDTLSASARLLLDHLVARATQA
jgi:DNA-binding transcriptional LysR family regulator